MSLRRGVAGLRRVSARLAEEDAEMADGSRLICRNVNVDALKVVGQDSAFPRLNYRSPFGATDSASRLVVGFSIVPIDEQRQPRRGQHGTKKERATKKQQGSTNDLFKHGGKFYTIRGAGRARGFPWTG